MVAGWIGYPLDTAMMIPHWTLMTFPEWGQKTPTSWILKMARFKFGFMTSQEVYTVAVWGDRKNPM